MSWNSSTAFLKKWCLNSDDWTTNDKINLNDLWMIQDLIVITSFFNHQLLTRSAEMRLAFISKFLIALCSSQPEILLVFFDNFVLCLLHQNERMLRSDAQNSVNRSCSKFKSLYSRWNSVIDLMNKFKEFKLSMLNACAVIMAAEMKEAWILLEICNKNDCEDSWFLQLKALF